MGGVVTASGQIRRMNQWCDALGLPLHHVEMGYRNWLSTPYEIGNCNVARTPGFANLPATYVAELPNTIAVGRTGIVVGPDGTILSDELASMDLARHTPRHQNLGALTRESCQFQFIFRPEQRLPAAIHLCGEYSHNYFHWLLECLPRLLLVNRFPHLDGIPILIEGGMPPQHEEALHLINEGRRPIIKVKPFESVTVDRLIYPSPLSVVYDAPGQFPVQGDCCISPVAIHELRERVLAAIGPIPENFPQRLYLTRRASNYRHLRNEGEIEAYLASQGFAILKSADFEFKDQVRLFASAKIVIGATGAAFTNTIFCAPNAQVHVLTLDNIASNPYVWLQLSRATGFSLTQIRGQQIPVGFASEQHTPHNDFIVDLSLIRQIV